MITDGDMADHIDEASRVEVINYSRYGRLVTGQEEDMGTTAVSRRRSRSKHSSNYCNFNSINVSNLIVIGIQLVFLSEFCRAGHSVGHGLGHRWFPSSPALQAGRGEGRSMLSIAATGPNSNCTKTYIAAEGETCASLRTSQNLSMPQLFEVNPQLNCKTLTKGQAICVQGISTTCGRTISVTKGPTTTTCASIVSSGGLTSDGLFILNPGLSCPEAAGNNNSWPSSHLICTYPGQGNLFFEYMGASGNPITFSDVSPLVQKYPSVVYHVILAFAIDNDANGTRTNGTFYPYWSEQLTPAAAKAFKAANPNAQILVSLGGASQYVNPNLTVDVVWEDPANTAEWIDAAQASLTAIASSYSIDGIDIDYEGFPNGSANFAFCIGTLIERLKGNKTIGLATIAPFGNVLPEYLNLISAYDDQVDYVNFQFYAYRLPNVSGYVAQFQNIAYQFPPWKLLASTANNGNYSITGSLFVQAVREIVQLRGLPGVMLYDADYSVAHNFTNENLVLSVLNVGSGSSTPVPAPPPRLGPSPVPSLGPAPGPPGSGSPTPAPGSSLAPAPSTPGGPAGAPGSSLAPASTPGEPAGAPGSTLAPSSASSPGSGQAPRSASAPGSNQPPGPPGSSPPPPPGPPTPPGTPPPSSAPGKLQWSRWSSQGLGLVTTVFVLLLSV